MQAIWNAPAHQRIVTLFWGSLGLNGLIILGALNHWYELEWPFYLSQLASLTLYVMCLISARSRQTSATITAQGLCFRDDTKSYQVELAVQDIQDIRVRRYPLLSVLVIDIAGNQRLSLCNVSLPKEFLPETHALLNAAGAIVR